MLGFLLDCNEYIDYYGVYAFMMLNISIYEEDRCI